MFWMVSSAKRVLTANPVAKFLVPDWGKYSTISQRSNLTMNARFVSLFECYWIHFNLFAFVYIIIDTEYIIPKLYYISE